MTVGSHQRPVGKNDERFTPQRIWQPLGPFDTDAATSAVRPWSIGQAANLTPAEDSLLLDWRGLGCVWLNPPFNRYLVGDFVKRMCAHNRGIMLLHQRHDAQWWQPIGDVAILTLEVAGRIVFHKADGSLATIDDPASKHYGKIANSGAGVTLIAFGLDAADRLAAVVRRAEYDGRNLVWPQGAIPGSLRLIRIPRGVLALALRDATWRELVTDALRAAGGPVSVSDLYRALAGHPKTRGNPNWKAKLRQTLQRGAGESRGRDRWVEA